MCVVLRVKIMLDVLLYLYEFYMGQEMESSISSKELAGDLYDAGFELDEIHKAFDWLDDLEELESIETTPSQAVGVRIFTHVEKAKLSIECRGFLSFLEQIGALDSVTRETVIDRAMALDTTVVDLMQLKCVVAMVFAHQSDSLQSVTRLYALQQMQPGNNKKYH